MAAQSFRDLRLYQKAHEFVLLVYRMSRGFPKEELFGLTSQLRRAAVSIPANVAEGFARRGVLDKLRFYNIAEGSLEECRYYLQLANDLDYANTAEATKLLEEVSRMLNAYIRTVRRNNGS